MKPAILVLVGHYLPGFRMGGPLRSIVNLVDRLHGDFDFRILTSDRDMGDATPYAGIDADRWMTVGEAQVRYMSPGRQRLSALARTIRETPHDILYLNSFFSPRFTVGVLAARRLGLVERLPTVLAPRGEFSQGALSLKSGKKRLYTAAARSVGMFSDIIWQASSDHEAADIMAALGKTVVDLSVAMNLAAPVNSQAYTPRQPGSPLRIGFVGRISPMKNLDYALKVLSLVKAPLIFSIFGPPENEVYKTECDRLMEKLPPNIRAQWRGSIDPSSVSAVMASNDLFFLPTRGENYGHVIAEALGAGTPVLIANTTPWRNLEEAGVGWDLPLDDPSAFATVIEAVAAQGAEAHAAQRERVFRYAKRRQNESADIEANRELFRRALASRQ